MDSLVHIPSYWDLEEYSNDQHSQKLHIRGPINTKKKMCPKNTKKKTGCKKNAGMRGTVGRRLNQATASVYVRTVLGRLVPLERQLQAGTIRSPGRNVPAVHRLCGAPRAAGCAGPHTFVLSLPACPLKRNAAGRLSVFTQRQKRREYK